MLPKQWTSQPLSNLAKYHNGRAFKPSDWENNGLPIIRIAQITNPNAEPNFYSKDDIDEKHLIDDGDLIFSWSATLAVMKWNRGPAILNQHLFKVEEADHISKNYLLYLLQHSLFDLAGHSHGSTMKHIKKSALDKYHAGIPPYDEQDKIAEILGTVDEAIEKTQSVIDQTARTKKALMTSLLTKGIPGRHTKFKPSPLGQIPDSWKVREGEYLFKLGGGHAPADLIFTDIGEYLYLKVDDLNAKENSDTINVSKLSFNLDEQSKNIKIFPKGSIIFAKRGAAIAKNRVRILGKDATIDSNLMCLQAENVNPEYIRYFLEYMELGNIADSSGVPQINNKHLYPRQFPCPSLNEQALIVTAIKSVIKTHKANLTSLEKLKKLKSSLMQVLLTGKVRVPLPTTHQQINKEVVNG